MMFVNGLRAFSGILNTWRIRCQMILLIRKFGWIMCGSTNSECSSVVHQSLRMNENGGVFSLHSHLSIPPTHQCSDLSIFGITWTSQQRDVWCSRSYAERPFP
jgi:hypothetical protein